MLRFPIVLLLPLLLLLLTSSSIFADSTQEQATATVRQCVEAAQAGDSGGSSAAATAAKKLLEARLQTEPSDVETRYQLAQVAVQCQIPFASMMARAGLAANAEGHLVTALEGNPDHIEARFLYATLLYHLPPFLGRTEDAIEQLQSLVSKLEAATVPSLPEAWVFLGELHQRQNHPDKARAVWSRGRALFPDHPGLHDRLTPENSQTSSSPPLLQSADPSIELARPALAAGLSRLVETELERPGQAGFAVAVAQQGQPILMTGFGLADLEQEVPMSAQSVLRIGSVSKQFLAVTALRLAELGTLRLDEPASHWLPELGDDQDTTLHHLLSHSAGLRTEVEPGGSGSTWLEASLQAPKLAPPGHQYSYSNLGYALAGVLIERATGASWPELLDRHAIRPAGLRATRLCDPRSLIAGRAQGYQLLGATLANGEPLGLSPMTTFSGGLCSSAEDLLSWQQALRSGQLIALEQVGQMRTPATLESGTSTYGYGLHVRTLGDLRVVHHGGGIQGFLSELAYFPDLDLDVVVLANSEAAAPRDLVRRMAAYVAKHQGHQHPLR